MGLLKFIRRIRAHGYALNFILKGDMKRLSAKLAESERLRGFDDPHEKDNDGMTW